MREGMKHVVEMHLKHKAKPSSTIHPVETLYKYTANFGGLGASHYMFLLWYLLSEF